MINNIEDIRNYMGGDNYDVPVYQPVVDHLQYLIDNCNKHGLPLPEIFPWYGGNGVQAEWEYKNNWYIEINSSSYGINGFFINDRINKEYKDGINCKFETIKDAFLLVKVFLESVVNK